MEIDTIKKSNEDAIFEEIKASYKKDIDEMNQMRRKEDIETKRDIIISQIKDRFGPDENNKFKFEEVVAFKDSVI